MSTSAYNEIFTADLTSNYIYLGLGALAIYEYLLTIPQEVARVWCRRCTLTTILFLFNRYLLIIVTVIQIVQTSVTSSESCHVLTPLGFITSMLQITVFALFCALRIYAIRGCSIAVSLLIFTINMVPVATNIVIYSRSNIEFIATRVLGGLCLVPNNLSPPIMFRCWLGLVTRLATIMADTIVLFATWRVASTSSVRAPIFTVLIRDGTVYFMVLLVLNVAQIIFESSSTLQQATPIITFIQTLTPIMISRFLLNLRQLPDNHYVPERFSMTTSIEWLSNQSSNSNTMGNLGQPLEHELENEEGMGLVGETNRSSR